MMLEAFCRYNYLKFSNFEKKSIMKANIIIEINSVLDAEQTLKYDKYSKMGVMFSVQFIG